MNKEIIPIFFTIDDGFSPYVSVAIKSLLDNASDKYYYHIHIVHDGLTKKNKERLKALETDCSKIIFSEMDKDLECITNKMSNRLRADVFSLAIFYRIFIPEMFPEYTKALYIDSDTVIPGDVSKLYHIDLEDNIIGAISDTSILHVKELTDYTASAVGVPCPYYVNSGVLLFDMQSLREMQLADKFLYLLNTYHFDSIAPDQDYINVLCKDKVKYVDVVWNAMPGEEIENPQIIHFNLFQKPWHYKDVLYEDYFWHYAKISGYYEEIKNTLDNFSTDDIIKDEQSLELMIKRAVQIVNSKGTFKEVFESGKEKRL